jgi:hypothetical protein
MYPLAHLAASLLLNEACRGDRASAAAGALAPDLTDKTLAWVLGVTPSGRFAAHSLAAAAAQTLVMVWLAGPRRGASFATSYLCHLVGDLWEGGHVPWLMPFRRYEYSDQRWNPEVTWGTLSLELVGIVLLTRLATRWAAEGKPRAGPSPAEGGTTDAEER